MRTRPPRQTLRRRSLQVETEQVETEQVETEQVETEQVETEGGYIIVRQLGEALPLKPDVYGRRKDVPRRLGSHPQDPKVDSCRDHRSQDEIHHGE